MNYIAVQSLGVSEIIIYYYKVVWGCRVRYYKDLRSTAEYCGVMRGSVGYCEVLRSTAGYTGGGVLGGNCRAL